MLEATVVSVGYSPNFTAYWRLPAFFDFLDGFIWKESSANICSISRFKSFANCRFLFALLFIKLLPLAISLTSVALSSVGAVAFGLLIRMLTSMARVLTSSLLWRRNSSKEASLKISSCLIKPSSLLSPSISCWSSSWIFWASVVSLLFC